MFLSGQDRKEAVITLDLGVGVRFQREAHMFAECQKRKTNRRGEVLVPPNPPTRCQGRPWASSLLKSASPN